MYLKSIDMYGFKSFANKIAFSFDEGITAIVGPNGSGKSNIADAVRWVLGEQSPKNLRGSNMKDVIFAGTETRKPLGYCQVDLTIDNADKKMAISYSEVTVSRRVYRSGESEYFINGTACRMKDVHELFMDTGVGKEGYSIIGQGQIDKILSSKPEDRRGLFDEAAGIVKYKKRKINAEKQLEEEEQNLIRINDIIRELKGQEASLRSQSEVAKVYLQLKEDLKKNEVNIYLNEVESMDKKIQELSEKEGIVYDQISDARKEKETLTKQQADTANSLESIDQQIANNQLESTQIAVEKEKRESNIKLAKEQINNIKVNNNRIYIENKTLSDKMHLKESELSLYEEQLVGIKATTKQQNSEVEAYEETLQQQNALIQSNESTIENIQADMIERLNEISSTKSKILRLSTILEGNEGRLSTLKAEKAELVQQEETTRLAATEGKAKLDQVEKKRAEYQKEKESLIKAIATAFTEKETLQNQLSVLKSNANKIESKHKALSEIAEGYEGYQHSIKSIMNLKLKNQPLGKGVLGVVSDILEVDEKFEKAVEIALGNKIQNIITDTEATAKSLIEYLKENRYGRATFLPLNGITALRPNPRIEKEETGFYGYGNEVVGCESKYDHILDYMIGRIGIVENMEVGISLSKKYERKVHLVTLAGEEIRPGGSITGGESNNRGNQLLGRKRQLDEIEVEIKAVNQQVVLAEKALEKLLIQINGQEKKKAFLTEEEKNFSIEYNRLAIELKQLETELVKHKEEQQSIKGELEQLLQQEITYKEQVATLEKTLEGTEGENYTKEHRVKELLEAITQLKVSKDALSDTLTELKVKASAFQSQLNHVKENKERILRELEEINSQIINNNETIMANETEISQKTLSITDALEASNASDVSIREKDQLIKGLSDEKHFLSKAREELYQQRELVNEQINQLEKELIRLQNQKEKIENAKNEQSTYMWNEYEITINNVSNYLDNNLGSINDMRKAIKSLKIEIKDLGPVNVNSIEEYKSVFERYEFLTIQRDDLIQSKEQIMEVIEELKNEMEVQFREKFKEISKKFTEVFKELFGGGKAFLELVEDHNILEAGIEIIAQPPGKKLQSMMLLSGGEKAFTAISLLFAIQSLKPSPFCVLDEIEAALDDANVVRFANYLSKLTKNTQFIIITHRKGTMEAADALYGITMQEKGISTQVSVKLLEDSIKE